MITLRKSGDRGSFNHGWLRSFHTFSFAGYHDPAHMSFGPLRVINEDVIAPGGGFDTHPHRDMEIVTYIVSGALEHEDSMGNGSVIRPGDVQYMSAGTGVLHSEYNHSKDEEVHLLQIWILPGSRGGSPLYGQKHFSDERRRGRLCQVVSGDGAVDSIAIRQDASIFASILDEKESVEHSLKQGRKAWVQLINGSVSVNGNTLHAGDGAAIEGDDKVRIDGASGQSEFLLFDLL